MIDLKPVRSALEMNEKPNVVVVVMRCSRVRKSSGVRFEKRVENKWVGTWAFELKEASAEREGYEKTAIGGSISLDNTYPGCPHCNARALFKCGKCNKVGCWDGESKVVICPWCGNKGEISGYIEILNASHDR